MEEQKLETLANMQLAKLIGKGQLIEQCKQEWYRRWKLDYPYFKSATGIKRYGEN